MKTKDGKYECDNCFTEVEAIITMVNGSPVWWETKESIVPKKLREKTGFEHLCKTCFDALRVELIRLTLHPPITIKVPMDME